MLNDANHPDISYTPAQVRQILHTDGDRLAQMQDELAWELGWSASTLDERKHLTSAVLALQNSLIVSSRDGAFVVDLPADLVRILQPAVAVFSKCALLVCPLLLVSR